MIKFKRTALALAAAFVTTTPALAADVGAKSKTIPDVVKAETRSQQKPSMGFMGGFAQTETRRDATTFGVDYTMQPTIPFAFGGEVLGYVSHGDQKHGTLTRTRVLAKGTYNFGGTFPIIKHSYVGVGLGPVIDNENHDVKVALGINPNIGFDIPLTHFFSNWSLGANAGYLVVTEGNHAFTANGVLKYWF